MYQRGKLILCLCWAALLFLPSLAPAAAPSVSLTVNGGKTYQTIEGFGVNANYYAWNNDDLEPALDALIDDAGMTLFRVVFNNGWETNNDNGDANVMNWTYYNTIYSAPNAQKLWGIMGYLNQRGITNGIMLNFQGPGPSWMMNGASLASGYENEWAEMIASLLIYARYTNQLQFNLVGPNNEPDITGEGINIPTVSQYLTTLHDLVLKLNTNGLPDMHIVAPDRSTANTNWLPELMTDPVIMSNLAHFGLHSYSSGGTGSQGVSNLVQRSAYPTRTFWMTEYNVWCDVCEYGASGTNNWEYSRGTVDYLLGHLANGVSAGLVWEGYDSYYPHHGRWSFWGLLAVDNTNATPKTYTPRKGFYALAQVAKFVRPGAQRIDATGSLSPLVAMAFYQTNTGQLSIVGENTGTTATLLTGRLTNLPPVNTLDFYYTDSSTNLYHSATIAVSNKTFSLTIPPDCVYTLSGTNIANSSVSVTITNPLDGAQFAAPANILIQADATTSTGIVSSVEFYSNDSLIGQTTNSPYSMTWSNVGPGIYTLSAAATNSLGFWDLSPDVQVAVTGPPAQIVVTPTNAVVVQYGAQQFAAAVLDAFGTELDPAPPLAWSVNGGGFVDGTGLFAAGGTAGGPFTVSAKLSSISGTGSVSVSTNLNLAPSGAGNIWYSLTSATANSPQAADDDINDGDLGTDVVLGPGGKEDNANAYEAAGILWSTPQTVNRVVYVNGSYNSQHDGVFAAQFGLQFTTDGTTWTPANAGWTLNPSYTYNSPASAHVQFTFNGPAISVLGVRAIGQVRTSSTSSNSWVAFATEVQAFAAPGIPAPRLVVSEVTNLITVWWPAPLTNYSLETCSSLMPSNSWSHVTNVPQIVGDQLSVSVARSPGLQFFRLHLQ